MTKALKRKLPVRITAFAICAVILCIFIAAYSVLQTGLLIADAKGYWTPDYDKADLTEILAKTQLTDEDYDVIYMQTGLTKIGVDRCLKHGALGRQRILDIQNCFFEEYNVISLYFGPIICEDRIDTSVSCVYLEDGDILVSSSTHISAWYIGHSGLVTSAKYDDVLQANSYGTLTSLGSSGDFTTRPTFMVLSPKVDAETKAQVVDFAKRNLIGISYSGAVGILSSKNSIAKTQCAHSIWYAYNQFGYDLDCNGGGLVIPQDLANSPDVEIVQIFGFDPVKLWK